MKMTYHSKFSEIKTLVDANQAVMLTGEKGTGKTTLAQQVAESLKLEFFVISMTRQTTLSFLLGFRNVKGVYIPTELRRAVEEGGLMLLDEIDAADPNVLLSLNTLENGYLPFPDGIVKCHPDFRLMATANPQDQHQHYTGRSKLDAATLDRFDIIDIDRDDALEATLVDRETLRFINVMRETAAEANSDIVVSMRDSLKYQLRKKLGLLDGFVLKVLGNNKDIHEQYQERIRNLPKFTNQAECKTFDDLVTLLQHN